MKRAILFISVVLFFVLVYFFLRWWILNWQSQNPLLTSEVNAAFITGLITFLTVIGMIVASVYSTKRNTRITIRDEIFRRRLEVYFQLLDYTSDMYRQVQDYINHPTQERQQKILMLEAEINKYVKQHRYNLSLPINKLIFNLIDGAENLVKSPRTLEKLIAKLSLENPTIISANQLESQFHLAYILPFHQQFEKELGFKSIEKELHDLR